MELKSPAQRERHIITARMAPFDEQEMKPMVVTEGVAAPAAAAAPRLSPLKVTLWCLVVALAGMAFMVTRIHAPTGSLRASAFPACQNGPHDKETT